MTDRDADTSPLLARLSMFRKVVPPATQLLPRALLRMLVAAFPVRTRVRELGRVVGTMYSRAGQPSSCIFSFTHRFRNSPM